MPEYLAPGVFIEETSFRHKSIEGVGTSVASIVGPTRTGPWRGTPEVVTSFSEFVRTYGDAYDLDFNSATVLNHTALAARAFFDNGGKQLFVSRVVNNDNANPATCAAIVSADKVLTFSSRFPGKMGNYTIELHWRDSVNLLSKESTTTPEDKETLFLSATAIPAEAKAKGAITDFPISVSAVVTRTGANLKLIAGEIKDKDDKVIAFDDTLTLKLDKLPPSAVMTRVSLKKPATGALAAGDCVELRLSSVSDISKFTGAASWGSRTVLRGSILAVPANGPLNTLRFPKSLNEGINLDIDIPLVALAALPNGVAAIMVQRNFDIDVHKDGKDGEIIFSRANLTTARNQSNSLDAALAETPARRDAQLSQPIACTLKDGDLLAALNSLFEAAPLNSPDPLKGPRYLFTLSGGADGLSPIAADYAGIVDEINGSTGLAALEGIEEISMVMTPAAAADESNHKAILMEVQKHCMKMRYRMGIAESREGMSLGEVRTFRNDFDDSRLALYHPWVVIADPTGQRNEVTVPPAGFVAGIYARTDVERGVHKSPANETVVGALRLEQEINRFQQELLNPNGINCLRSFPGRGHRVWGGRTLSSDPEWKYVNVRRYFLYLERSVEKSTQWAVFEPNGEALWANIRSTVEDFLFNEWKSGRLLGGTPKEAYFVRCDRSTMTQNDIDNGRMICVVGVAALTPAEFVVFRIGQKTADA